MRAHQGRHVMRVAMKVIIYPEEIGVGALLIEVLEGDPVDGHGIRLSVGSHWQTEPT